jgi:hypothetical protein
MLLQQVQQRTVYGLHMTAVAATFFPAAVSAGLAEASAAAAEQMHAASSVQ